MDDEILTRREAAAYLKLTEDQLAQMAHRKTGPQYARVSYRTTRYRKADLDAWLAGLVRDEQPA